MRRLIFFNSRWGWWVIVVLILDSERGKFLSSLAAGLGQEGERRVCTKAAGRMRSRVSGQGRTLLWRRGGGGAGTVAASRLLLLGALVAFAAGQLCTENPVVNPVTATMALPGSNTDPSGFNGGQVVGGPATITVTSDGQRDAMHVMTGAIVNVTITASWGGAYTGENITMFAYEEPGIPNGGVLAGPRCGASCNPVTRTFQWKPTKSQEGKTHSMCFVVHPKTASLAACTSAYRCIDFTVAAPDLQFGGSTPADNTLVYSAVGCRLEICPTVQDMSGIYDVDVNPVAGTMPPGARFDVGCAAQAQSTSLHPLFPILAYPMRRTQSCTRCMHFEAVRGGETKNYTACFQAGDTNGMKTIRTCVRIHVPKCQYCIQEGDSLHFINKKFHLNSNWLQLYNANGIGELGGNPLSQATPFYDPDQLALGNSVINLGPSYAVQAGESLSQLAAQFRTTVRKLLDINPDIKDEESLREGNLLCVMPCTDGTSAVDNMHAQVV